MTSPIRNDLHAVTDREALRLGRQDSEGHLTHGAAVSTLPSQVPDRLTRLGAADMLDHWDQSLSSYTGSFEMLIGRPEMFTSPSPRRQLAQQLPSVIACADNIAALPPLRRSPQHAISNWANRLRQALVGAH